MTISFVLSFCFCDSFVVEKVQKLGQNLLRMGERCENISFKLVPGFIRFQGVLFSSFVSDEGVF